MKIVRASSSMPVFMQPTEYRGLSLMDGGLGEGGGIALPAAKRDGFQKFFVVLTREKGYRKAPIKSGRMLRVAYWNYPELIWALENRHNEYNRALEELRQLELEGKALLVYPETMPVSNRESNYRKLSESYSLGHTQGMRELPRWKEFLGIS
ncbi:hypothetical protein SDC9_201742 [bioreactor metagenome]|uniref:DUF6363 domain-containing protein n=1 Tax=bioreactor metagenome TaxID=1076179 RepID=A0A645J3L4_9ZZZZ